MEDSAEIKNNDVSGDDVIAEPGSPRVADKESKASEAGAEVEKNEGIVLKIEGEDWIDVVRMDSPVVKAAEAGEGETAGEEEVEARVEEPSVNIDTPVKTETTEDPLARFVPHGKGIRRKMRKRQIEGSETNIKRTVQIKYNADKAYEIQFDVQTAHHEFDDKTPEQILDLCLIMDCTGSMSSWIAHCKETLHKVIDATVARDPNCKVRTAFVGYRDFCDKDALFALHDFSYDADAVKKFISGAQAKGGGDFPEDVQGAFRKALDLSWSGLDDSVKLAVLVADAPAHGSKYHVGHKHDDFPDGNPAGLVLEDMMKEMSDNEILISLYQLNNENQTMYNIMKDAHAQGEEKEGVEFVDMRDMMPQKKKRIAGRRSSRAGGSPATLADPRDGMRRAYSARTSHTIEAQCAKMRSPMRLSSRRSCKSGW